MEVFEIIVTTLGGGTAILASVKGAIKYATTRMEIYKEQARQEREEDRKERAEHNERLLAQIDKRDETNQTLLKTNMELAEGYRILANEHSVKINRVENTVLVMDEKLNTLLEREKE